MSDQPQAPEDPRVIAELEIQQVVKEGVAKWRTARQQANPYGHVTVTDELEMRRCITELERARRGLPLATTTLPRASFEWNGFTYLEAQQSPIVEPPWKIKGLVVEGSATQISAQPHGMKSLSWLNAALEAVSLHTVWKHFDASKVERALYIESEDPEWLVKQRIKGIAKGLGLDPDKELPGFYCVCPGPFNLVQEEEAIRELISKHRPDFVVLSTLQNLLGGRDWNQQKEMQDVNALIVRLSRICPLVVLTHSPWKKELRRAAGTITQFANFAIAMHYQKVKLTDGGTAVHVVVDSKLGGVIDDFHLNLLTEGAEDDHSSVRGLAYGGEGQPQGANKQAIIEELANDPDATAEEIAERVGVSDRYVRKVKAELPKKGHRRGKGKASQSETTRIEPNDPCLTSEIQAVDLEADAYGPPQQRGRR